MALDASSLPAPTGRGADRESSRADSAESPARRERIDGERLDHEVALEVQSDARPRRRSRRTIRTVDDPTVGGVVMAIEKPRANAQRHISEVTSRTDDSSPSPFAQAPPFLSGPLESLGWDEPEESEASGIIRPMRIISIGFESSPAAEVLPESTIGRVGSPRPLRAPSEYQPSSLKGPESTGGGQPERTSTGDDGRGREVAPVPADIIEALTDDDLEADGASDPGLAQAPPELESTRRKPLPPPLKRMVLGDSASSPASPSAAESSTLVPATLEPGRKRAKAWWEEMFSDDFLRTMVRADQSVVTRECDFIEERLGLEKGAIMLDLGCGSGEHAVELARRGYNVVGYDLSLPMLARAQDEAQDRGQQINFLQGDMREMAFEDSFDGVYCWSTTFGYFDDDKNLGVLARIHRGLRQGGMLLLDVANRDYIGPRQPSSVWFEGDGCVCMDEMVVDFFTSRLRVKRTVMFEDGRARECDYSIRLYALHELGKILHDAGFKVLEVTGHPAHPGVFFGAESPRIIVLAERS
jgi:SAM-dependent methyltransferase